MTLSFLPVKTVLRTRKFSQIFLTAAPETLSDVFCIYLYEFLRIYFLKKHRIILKLDHTLEDFSVD